MARIQRCPGRQPGARGAPDAGAARRRETAANSGGGGCFSCPAAFSSISLSSLTCHVLRPLFRGGGRGREGGGLYMVIFPPMSSSSDLFSEVR